ncbi:hypothetical protein [Glaciecola sp. 1036]|uniref:hypothetical protein n=1 Tax=Alteromonadaceae TaxID=72275 RepID=UPI003D00990A
MKVTLNDAQNNLSKAMQLLSLIKEQYIEPQAISELEKIWFWLDDARGIIDSNNKSE